MKTIRRGTLVAFDGRVAVVTAITRDGLKAHLTYLDDGQTPERHWSVPLKLLRP